MQKQAAGVGKVDGIECWEEAVPTTFMVRGLNYMQDKKKVASEDSIYRQAYQSICPTPMTLGKFTALPSIDRHMT